MLTQLSTIKSRLAICASGHAEGTSNFSQAQVLSGTIKIAIDNHLKAINKDATTLSSGTYRFDNSVSYFDILGPGEFLVSAERVYETVKPKEGELAFKLQTVVLKPTPK